MPDTFIYAFLAILGLIIGSFLNVVILRFGYTESRESRSHCMACNTAISSYDLIPLLSFLWLSAKCRSCGSKLSLQYPFVELLTAFLFVFAYAVTPPLQSLWSVLSFAALLAFLSSLLVLVVYDLRHTVVPFPMLAALFASSVAAVIFQSIGASSVSPLVDGALGGTVLFFFFFAIYGITRGRGMGMGDAYVAASAGVLLGLVRGIEAVMLAFWIGTIIMLPFFLLSSVPKRFRHGILSGRVTMKTELPFVPFIAVGIIVALMTDISPLAFGTWLAEALWFRDF